MNYPKETGTNQAIPGKPGHAVTTWLQSTLDRSSHFSRELKKKCDF